MSKLKKAPRYIVTDKTGYIKAMGRIVVSEGRGHCLCNYSFKPPCTTCNEESVSFYPDLTTLFLEKELKQEKEG